MNGGFCSSPEIWSQQNALKLSEKVKLSYEIIANTLPFLNGYISDFWHIFTNRVTYGNILPENTSNLKQFRSILICNLISMK